MATWNAQSLCCEDRNKFRQNKCLAKQLAQINGIICIQETFGTKGIESAWKPPDRFKAWWSHCTTRPTSESTESKAKMDKRKGGIVTLVADTLLKSFNHYEWEVVSPGRAAILHLQGSHGNLDIYNAYMPASSSKDRFDHIRCIAKKVVSQDKVLTLLAGDWNFTDHKHDRFCKKRKVTGLASPRKRGGIILHSPHARARVGRDLPAPPHA